MTSVHTRRIDEFTHDCRAFLFDQIRLRPGINLSTLSDRTATSMSTIRHHLRVLERSEVIRSEKRRGKRRFYPSDFDADELESAIGEGPAALIDALDSLEEPSGLELAAELDQDPSTISYHLTRLDDAGVISRKRDGRTVVNALTPAAEERLSEETASSPDRPVLTVA